METIIDTRLRITAAVIALLLAGCSMVSDISHNLKRKTVNYNKNTTGVKLTTIVDSTTGSISPQIDMGNMTQMHQSAPILPGQSVYTTTKWKLSLFGITQEQEATTFVGKAPDELFKFLQEHPEILDRDIVITVDDGTVVIKGK